MRRLGAALACAVVLQGCGLVRSPARPRVPDEEARHRAALASVSVVNLTVFTLRISYRTATPPIQEVALGTVAAASRVNLPPMPAGEPLFLLARRQDMRELTLGPRSFAIDERWTWEIPANATFRTR